MEPKERSGYGCGRLFFLRPAFRTFIALRVRCIFIPGRSGQRRPENVQYPKRAQQQWTEWFGLLTGAMYIPIEPFEIMRGATWPKVTVLVINAGIVGYLGYILLRSRHGRKHA